MYIEKNKSLKTLNTFMVDISTKQYIEVTSIEDLHQIHSKDILKDQFFILGGGSNTLFTKDFDGTVIHINIKGKEVTNESNSDINIKVNAGENWTDFVKWCVDNNYLGIQNLAYIPGSCGAAPVQNIGAYGSEIKDNLVELEYFDIEDGNIKTLNNKECKFEYRNSIFKNELKSKAIIVSTTYKLQKWTKEKEIPEQYLQYKGITDHLEQNNTKPYTIEKVYNSIVSIRKEKLPEITEYGSCGSTFANPIISKQKYSQLTEKFPELPQYPTDNENMVKIPAAYILEKLGWKNKRIGECGTWVKHPLIVTNYGNSKGEEVLELIKTIQKDFEESTGVQLNTEINII
jgi:UDP-N-acetylmuramate dehydrogenase